jgi:hypothetical protein
MNSRIRHATYLLVGISIVLTLLLAYPDVNRSGAKASAVVPAADLTARRTAQPVTFGPLPSPTPIGKPGVVVPTEGIILARTNYALASHGGTASALSSFAGSAPSGANDGDRKGLNFGKDGYWNSKTATFPQWLEIDFKGKRTITEIDLFTIQDDYASPVEPNPRMEFTKYGLTDFDVEYWTEVSFPPPIGAGGLWVPIPGGSVRGNKLVWKRFDFSTSPITTTKIRVKCLASPDNFSRIAELEAWSK